MKRFSRLVRSILKLSLRKFRYLWLQTGETRCSRRLFVIDKFFSSTRNCTVCQPSHRQQIVAKMLSTRKTHRCVFSTFGGRQTFVIDCIKMVSVKTVVDHKILSTSESRRREKLLDNILSRLSTALREELLT